MPQQIELEGAGHIVAYVGQGLAPLAFSSVAAPPVFIESDQFQPFLRAFAKAKAWARETPPLEVARTLAPLFPALHLEALTSAIAACQKLGCWKGDAAIPRADYNEAERAFLWAGGIQRAHAYEEVCHA
jgi:ABC-type nitrate/sulfonate/bicarbonate transport system substrate-binding protein